MTASLGDHSPAFQLLSHGKGSGTTESNMRSNLFSYWACVGLGWNTLSHSSLTCSDRISSIISKWEGDSSGKSSCIANDRNQQFKRCAYQCLAMQLAIDTNRCGFWKVLNTAICDDMTKKVCSTFADIGIRDVDTVTKDLGCIDFEISTAVRFLGGEIGGRDASHHQTPAVSCLLGVGNSMLFSQFAQGTTRDSVPNSNNVQHAVISLLQRHWRDTIDRPVGLHGSLLSVSMTGDLLLSGMLDFAYSSRRGFTNNDANCVKQALDVAMNVCKKSLNTLCLPLPGPSSGPAPIGMEEDAEVASVVECKYRRIDFALASDIDQRSAVNAIFFLNHCMKILPDVLELPDRNTVATFVTALSHLVTTVSLCMYKILVFLYTCSLRALLREITAVVSTSSSRSTPNVKCLCILVVR